MARNLDLTALRSFVTVAETGGVTKAAQQLHLTQSAVSMQLKRLEESLAQPLLDRSGRGVTLTNQGEQLLSYGRRMLVLNDEVMARMTDDAFEGEVRFGVPADIVYPNIPKILQRFDRAYPRVRVNLFSSYTRKLKAMIDSGDLDLILTTEDECGPQGETISMQHLVWVGAPGGTAFRGRPLRLAFERACLFRPWVQRALDERGIAWEMAVDTNATRTVEAGSCHARMRDQPLSGAHRPWRRPARPALDPGQHVPRGKRQGGAGGCAGGNGTRRLWADGCGGVSQPTLAPSLTPAGCWSRSP
jgi:DNA-binding transcriptional LysR family regulator